MAKNFSPLMAMGQAGYDSGLAFGRALSQASINRGMAAMNADMYRSQARLALLRANRQSAYINEEAAQQVWNTADAAAKLRGSQVAAMGASGFDVSAGDQRVLQDTERRAAMQAAGINRSAYLQNFENQLQAAMEASRLEYAAKAQDAIRKQNSSRKALLSGAFAALGAFASNAGNLASSGAFGGSNANVSPVNSKADVGYSGKFDSANKLSLGYGKQSMYGWGGF